MEKIVDIIYAIAYEKNLEVADVQEVIKTTFSDMAKETIDSNFEYSVYIEEKSKSITLFKKIFVVEEGGDIAQGHVSLQEAKEVDENIVVGDFLELSIDLETLSRGSVNYLYQEIEKRLQNMIDDKLFGKYEKLLNTIVNAKVTSVDDNENTIVDINEVKGVLPMKNRIKGERFKVGDTFQAILSFVKRTRYGIHIELSRTKPKFLQELLHLEVPELKDGQIEIVKVARVPGVRAKIVIKTHNTQIDPIGAIVGVKGVRVRAVSEALNGENIDCIEECDEIELFITRSLSPAIVTFVRVDSEQKRAIVTLAPDQKKKAIGSKGHNIRLASMLTDYQIDLLEEEVVNRDSDQPTSTSASTSAPASALDELFS